jgi:hypothetical protein
MLRYNTLPVLLHILPVLYTLSYLNCDWPLMKSFSISCTIVTGSQQLGNSELRHTLFVVRLGLFTT